MNEAKYKIKVRYVFDSFTNTLGCAGWLVGKGANLAIGNMYTDVTKAESYSEAEIVEILQRDNYGRKFVLVEVIAA